MFPAKQRDALVPNPLVNAAMEKTGWPLGSAPLGPGRSRTGAKSAGRRAAGHPGHLEWGVMGGGPEAGDLTGSLLTRARARVCDPVNIAHPGRFCGVPFVPESLGRFEESAEC